MFLKEFQTSEGIVDVAANARVRSDVLQLKDIAVFPRQDKVLDIGPRQVIQIRNQLINDAKSQNFKRLRITGERISGANPGKKVNIKIDLNK